MRSHLPLVRALAALIALGLATTAIAALRGGPTAPWSAAGAAALLVLAGVKADIILARYLALRTAPAWLRGFRAALVILLLTLYAIWLIPALV